MRLNVVLHEFFRAQPGGGLKVEYEYANRMAARGHDVVIYHSLNFGRGFVRHPRSIGGLLRVNLAGSRAVEWFPVSAAVRCRYLPRIAPALLRAADVTILDSFLMSERLPQATARTGALVHMVYEYPVWTTGEQALRDRLERSFRRSDIARIATSIAVEDMLIACGAEAVGKVTCGIDLPKLAGIPPNGNRIPTVGFALRQEPHKGLDDVLHALDAVRSACPDVQFEAFGSYPNADRLPGYVRNLGRLGDDELRAFYQRISVFVSPSHAEGWGLTVAEAMANGAAVVTADNGGSADFAHHNQTALVVPVGDAPALACATTKLLSDDALRTRLVQAGIARSREMSWERSVSALEALLVQLSEQDQRMRSAA